MTILHMLLPSLVQVSFCWKHLSIVSKLKEPANGIFPLRTDRCLFFFKFFKK